MMRGTCLLALFGALGAAQESATEGHVEFGYRGVSGLRGNTDAYRSIVNLGEGPKLFHLDLNTTRSQGWWRRLELRADSWGGEPYNSTTFRLSRDQWYKLNVSYRNLTQFNRLPSFTSGQQALDTRRRDSDLDFELLPGRTVTPFFGWTSSAGTGAGLTHYVATGNEYAVVGALEDVTHLIRGGVRLERKAWHVSVEQGGLRYRQNDDWAQTGANTGALRGLFLGQRLQLDSLRQTYRVKGSGPYSKGVFTANPAQWIDLSGSFVFTQPRSTIDYSDQAAGRFVLFDPLRFTSTLSGQVAGTTRMPHTSGWFSAELRPHDRVRLVESWLTDRLRNAADPLRFDWSRQQAEGFINVARGLTLHGGHRYEWADSRARVPLLSGPSAAQLRRHVGLAGVRAHYGRVLVSASYEGGVSDKVLYRTSVNDFHRFRGRARVEATQALSIEGNWNVLDNRNPSPLGAFEWLARSQGATVTWSSKRLGALWGSYSRAAVDSRIPYIEPQDLRTAQSIFKENSHTITGLWESGAKRVRLGLGGAAFVSSGTRPTRLWEPVTRLTVPLSKRLAGRAEWRWHGLTEPFYVAEGFRAHLWTLSLIGSVK